jgi:hypothetical protein
MASAESKGPMEHDKTIDPWPQCQQAFELV